MYKSHTVFFMYLHWSTNTPIWFPTPIINEDSTSMAQYLHSEMTKITWVRDDKGSTVCTTDSSPESETRMTHKAFYRCPLISECFSCLFFFYAVPSRHSHIKIHAFMTHKSMIMGNRASPASSSQLADSRAAAIAFVELCCQQTA